MEIQQSIVHTPVVNVMINSRIYCRHCPNSDGHIYVCNCGHSHNEHNFCGGCTARDKSRKMCECDNYSQTKKVKANAKS